MLTDLRAAAESIRRIAALDTRGNPANEAAAHREILGIGAAHGFGTADPRGVKDDGAALIDLLEAKAAAIEAGQA